MEMLLTIDRRLGLAFVALALFASSAGFGAATAQAEPPSAAKEDAGAVYGVAVPQGQQLSYALGQLAIVRPELQSQILRTLDSGTVPGGAKVAAGVRSSTIVAANPNPSELQAARSVVALNGTSSFEGAMTITGFDCNRSGCVPASTITHNAVFDLGYTTYAVTGKTSASSDRSFWFSVGASGFCSIGPRSSCSSTQSYPAGSTWLKRIFSFNTTMGGKTARIYTTFTAAWRGSPASMSGYTPYFSCSSANRFCRFT